MNNEKNNSSLPFAIIGLVLLAAIVGFWWFYSGANSPSGKTNSNKTAANSAEIYAKAAPGANPPNYLGGVNAPVVLEEFADFQCPTCAAMHPKVQEVRAAYGDRIKVIFREFPLNIPAHDKAYDAAAAAEAAGMQGKFWEMQNMLFSNQRSWEASTDHRKVFTDYAQKIGLDATKFSDDMIGIPAKSRVDADLQRGRSLNVNATPTFYLNGRKLGDEISTVEGMRAAIDAELQKAGNK